MRKEDSEIPSTVVVKDSLKSPLPRQFDADSVLPAPSVTGSVEANVGTDEGLQTISLSSDEDEVLHVREEDVFLESEALAAGTSSTLERSRAEKLKRSSLKKVDSIKKAFSRQSIEKKMTKIGTKIVPPERREKIKKSFTPNHPKSPTSQSSSFKVSPMTFNVKKVRDSGVPAQDGGSPGKMAHVEIPTLGSMDGEASMAEVHPLCEGLEVQVVDALLAPSTPESLKGEHVVNGDSGRMEGADLSCSLTPGLALPEQDDEDGEDGEEEQEEEKEQHEVAVNGAADIAADVAADVTTDIAADVSTDVAADVSTDVAADIAANVTADVAADVAADVTADVTADVMANVAANNVVSMAAVAVQQAS
ncbi:Caveolae-associated protein 2 [Merluccius polli]|uniref:Caveolae-associated protein 2 n=1 Tax=Merluccius polli TaxID=89951 RepID=A0AA47P5E6_MERPO|nr:Caveolae-associated protein 2 [Merluccius polli]